MKKILVTQSSMPSFEEYCEEIESIWDTIHLTNNGPKHKMLEQQLKEYLRAENMTLVTNGHLALQLALKVLNLTGEVITTPFTFVSTVNAIVENGLTPVFCDINPESYTIDADKIEDLITDKTSAILAVHVYGNVCDVEKLEKLAKKHNLKLIYDAAHVFGVTYKGKSVTSFGDISMLSFHATKVFNTIEGGGLIYHSEELYSKLDALKNFGISQEGDVPQESINAKMNEFQAAMGICNLRHVDNEILKRRNVVKRYRKNLQNRDGIRILVEQNEVQSNYAYFPVVFEKEIFGKSRDEVAACLERENIFARKYFYPIVSEFSYYKKNCSVNETPIAKEVSEKILCLPLYANLTEEDVDRICKIILGE